MQDHTNTCTGNILYNFIILSTCRLLCLSRKLNDVRSCCAIYLEYFMWLSLLHLFWIFLFAIYLVDFKEVWTLNLYWNKWSSFINNITIKYFNWLITNYNTIWSRAYTSRPEIVLYPEFLEEWKRKGTCLLTS